MKKMLYKYKFIKKIWKKILGLGLVDFSGVLVFRYF